MQTIAATEREVILMNFGWKFQLGEVENGENRNWTIVNGDSLICRMIIN